MHKNDFILGDHKSRGQELESSISYSMGMRKKEKKKRKKREKKEKKKNNQSFRDPCQ
jgi:hypothetical protein